MPIRSRRQPSAASISRARRAARVALFSLLAHPAQADRQYDSLAESRGGRIISTDLARFLDARYRDTPAGQPRDLVPSWDLAWRYAQDRLARELSNRGPRQVMRFMAGGWGAGKTHALQHEPPSDLAWDGTLQDSAWARRMIDLAHAYDWQVEIAYVFRDIELALYGAVERAQQEGRSVPLGKLPANHRAVQRSILRLVSRYRGKRAAFLLLHNTGTKEVRGEALVIHHRELARGGALRYTQRYEDYYTKAARDIQALNPVESPYGRG